MATVDITLIGIPTFADLPSNLVLFPTDAPSDIATYYKMVQSISDPDYPEPAVNFSTPAITTTGQLLAKLATSPGVLAGNPGIINITTLGNIRRVSGTGLADFYFEVYHRDGAGIETLISTSNNTTPIDTATFEQFSAIGLLNNGDFSPTDRIVIYYYANRIPGGSNPVYEFQFGGASPVRTFLPVPASNILNVPLVDEVTEYLGGTNGHVVTIQSGKVKSAPFPTTSITIGTTAITSGTVGRVLFEGAGNVVQESANLFWDNTNVRLGIGTSSPFGKFDVKDGEVFVTTSTNANLRSRLTYQGLYVSRATDGTYTEGIYSTTSAWLYTSRNSHSFFRDGVNLFNVGGGFASGAMNIFTNGNVAINTTTDAGFKFDVNGNARVSGRVEIQNTSGLNIRTTVGAVSTAFRPTGNDAEIRTNDASIASAYFYQNGNVGFSQRVVFGSATLSAASAQVQIDSTTRGFLPPRMTTTEKNAIASPAAGLMVYDTTLNLISVYNGTTWITL